MAPFILPLHRNAWLSATVVEGAQQETANGAPGGLSGVLVAAILIKQEQAVMRFGSPLRLNNHLMTLPTGDAFSWAKSLRVSGWKRTNVA